MSFLPQLPIINIMKIGLNEKAMAETIKHLLSLTNTNHYNISNIRGKVEIYFKGDMRAVREEIYKWLSEKKSKEVGELIKENE